MFSAKILFFLLSGTAFLQYTSQDKQIRGTPEVDFPTYYVIPKTSFRCSDQLYNPGFYADTETRCQVFHYCFEHRQDSFLCPMGTVFNQPLLACDYWYSSNCSIAPSYYHVNAVKGNENYFDEADDHLNSQSGNVFDKMAHLYETNNKIAELSASKYDSDNPEMDLFSKNTIESSSEPLIEDYNKYGFDNQFNMVDENLPEIIKYETVGLNAVKIHDGPENDQLYKTGGDKDFILSEDGTLHSSQEDIYQSFPTDMNFDQGSSGYAEIPSEENLSDDLNKDYESDLQVLDYELQKRNMNRDHRRRPSSRKPIIIVPKAEPKIVSLPVVVKHKRKPIGISPTISAVVDDKFSLGTIYDSNIHNEDIASLTNEGLGGTASSKLLLEEQANANKGLQMHQMENSNAIFDYPNKKNTLNEYALHNQDEDEISPIFGLEDNDFFSISNAEPRDKLTESNYGDQSEIFIENFVGSTIHPDESPGTAVDSDPFIESVSEENIISSDSSDISNFLENQVIFSDGEDVEIIDGEISYVLPMNLSNTFEGSSTSVLKTTGMLNFEEDTDEPVEYILKDDSEDGIEYSTESSFSSETYEKFPSSEDNEEMESESDGIGGSSELQAFFDISQDHSDETIPEIREIEESYYIFSDSEYHPNSEYEDLSEFNTVNEDYVVTENFEDDSDELTDNGFQYITEDSKLNTEQILVESETETSPHIPEKYAADDIASVGQLSSEDLKFLEIMSQTPLPMPKNLFDVSYEISNSGAANDEILPPEQDIDHQVAIHENPNNVEDTIEFESISSDNTQDIEEHPVIMESSDNTQDIEEHSVIMESSKTNSEILDSEQKIEINVSHTEGSSDTDSEILDSEQKIEENFPHMKGSGQDESQTFLPKQNSEFFIPGKESDPFGPLFVESEEILLDSPEIEQKSYLKIDHVEPKSAEINPVKENLKKVARGKRFNENLRIFNPSDKGNPRMAPSRETFREAVFSNIPTTFLKMKHSTLRPYFYKYELKNSGINSRSGDMFKPSKFSKLTSFGKRLLEAKQSKFNTMKKYIESYRNN